MRLFDLHCDTVTVCEEQGYSLLDNPCHISVKRAASMYEKWIQTAAIFVPDTKRGQEAWDYTCRVMHYVNEQAQEARGAFGIVKTTDDLDRTCPMLMLSVESGAAIGGELSRIHTLSESGVVAMNITWNGSNELAHGCLSSCSDGLTSLGKEAISVLMQEHILADVSHLNEAGFWDVMTLCQDHTVIASHSLSATVHQHPRNLTDEQFRAIKHRKGLVGLHLCDAHLGTQTFECFERHLEHFLSLDGADTVAIGMDLDGTDMPKEWGGIAVGNALYEYLYARGYPISLLDRLFFENSYTFFQKTLTTREECIRIRT